MKLKDVDWVVTICWGLYLACVGIVIVLLIKNLF